MEKDSNAQLIARQLLSTIALFQRSDRKAQDFDTGQKLYLAEINLMEFIGDRSGCCASEFATENRITKGAVSQTVRRLEAKGYITRADDPICGVRSILSLTEKGKAVYGRRLDYRKRLDGFVLEALEHCSAENQSEIWSFLKKLETFWE
ncbi:MarR family winged helix-turn-helix transcriptional regulator [Oscillospiraceae bacterium MB08-C2-2]|nr:MarR family winged helix-turn-helix transcriptional regulator [Oscillospiraceae bacterium MB08-C2-2]